MMIWSGKIIPFSSRSFSKFLSCSTPCWAPIDFKERSMGVQSKMRIKPHMHNFCGLLFITYTISTGFEKALTEVDNSSRNHHVSSWYTKRYHQLCQWKHWTLWGKDHARSLLLSSSIVITLAKNNNIYVVLESQSHYWNFYKTTGMSESL